ncbi:MAG: DNA mismatch repair endonuclease MutL [Firmicutes bacterium]|nr:DNA mismatch repair endonuclease MutL [Bacillota bacterium]
MTYEKIRQLPKDIADKIAAGEVVERPLSIVKELAENAVDAGAGFITVEISRGGKEYIRVSDNGKGIPKDQLALAVRRYASSKIYTEEDLSSIETLGFRGEALASIGAVSALEIVSKPASQSRGAGIRVEGGAESEPYDAACENGTTVIVRDLFYNLPARRKFLRADNAETSLITDFVSKLAIAYPSIRVRLISNGTILFSTTGKGDLRQAILTVYSRAVSDSLLPVDRSDGGIRVSGFVSDPLSGRTSRRYQIFFVNGRLIRSKLIEGALDYAYRDKMFEGRYPAAFLFISVPPESVDVNIHPSKTEIRFFDEQPLRDAVILAVRSALMDPAALAVRDEELGSGADPAVSSAGAAAAGMHASSAGDASYIPAVSLPSRADALGELARLRESSRSSGSEAILSAVNSISVLP